MQLKLPYFIRSGRYLCQKPPTNFSDEANLKVKRRESFRPFSPSVLREGVADWFEQDDEVPFMMKVFQIREEKRSEIPAVTHVDGSGRLQTVYAETNPRYHALFREFEKLSGVPMVLNTSFNENEPVVCKRKRRWIVSCARRWMCW
jgi:carbamoyltransferase